MSTPVVTDKWSGTFDCGYCKRKRLVAAEFSKKALEKYRRQGGLLKCKKCVASMEAAERKAATDRANNAPGNSISTFPPISCASCKKSLPYSSFNKNQYNKGTSKGRCRACVEKSLEDEKQQTADKKSDKLKAAKAKVDRAKTPMEKLKAESELSALEAEHVTGLKPMKMGRGGGRRGRFSSRGGGRGRGRGRGGRG